MMKKNFKFWPEGVFKELSYPKIPIFEILRSSARRWPDRNAILFGGMEMTYRELDLLSDRFATALADIGVKKGDRVGIHLPNCPQFAVAYYGLLKAGAIFVPLSPLLAEREIDFELNDAGVETFIGLDLLFLSSFPGRRRQTAVATCRFSSRPRLHWMGNWRQWRTLRDLFPDRTSLDQVYAGLELDLLGGDLRFNPEDGVRRVPCGT